LYTVLDTKDATKGKRVELWHGWPSAIFPPSWKSDESWIREELSSDELNEEDIKNKWKNYGAEGRKDRYEKKFKSDEILTNALNEQLCSMRIFVTDLEKDLSPEKPLISKKSPDSKKNLCYRLEAALMHGLYYSKEPWSELADRGMNLTNVRSNKTSPIAINHEIKSEDNKEITIYGLFDG